MKVFRNGQYVEVARKSVKQIREERQAKIESLEQRLEKLRQQLGDEAKKPINSRFDAAFVKHDTRVLECLIDEAMEELEELRLIQGDS